MARIFSISPKVFFIVILIISSLTITGVSLITIYKRAIESLQSSLTDMVNHQETMVKVLKDQGKSDSEIISFFRQMREKHYGLGKTGEIVIAWISEDSIEYILSSQPHGKYAIPLHNTNHGLPMKFALSGQAGFVRAEDYRGIKVYSAYVYIPETKWGIVAKISAKEIESPYIQTSIFAFFISIVLISFCGIIYTRITNPLIKKIVDNEEKFRSLFESITEGVALHEIIYENTIPVDYRIIDVNPAFRVHTGIDTVNAINKTATELYGTGEPPYLKEYSKVADSRIPIRFETFFPAMNKYFIISAISPKKGLFATVFEDITEQKKNEQEIKQKNEELTRFIYTVSHDLKSPLVTIKSFTSYLKEDIEKNDKASQERDMGFIQNATDKMGKLLDELLEFSRIGKKEKPKSEILLETLLKQVVDLVAGQISSRNVTVRLVGPPVMLYGHTQRFVQVYQNLIDNAVKFMGNQPEPLVEIGAMNEKNENGEVVLFVRDNGSGIDPRYHHKLFGLFEKLDTTSEGTGIGLALVKRIVEVHGGLVWFTSDGANKGTTFYFTLENTRLLN